MKDLRYANRGQDFESLLRFANEQYKHYGQAVIQKIPTEFIPLRDGKGRVCNVKVVGKSAVDFIGRVRSMPVAIEAKETSGDSIRVDAVQDHQADFLDAFTEGYGTLGYVVLSYRLNRFFVVPWEFWKAGRDAWKDAQERGKRKAEIITIEHDEQVWSTPGKASVKADELLSDWEVFTGGKVVLDYLNIYK